MTDKLTKHEPAGIQPRNMQELSEFARMASASGFFADAREAAQAMVKIAAGAEMGIAPIQAMTSIHVIKGKITLSANLVAAMLKRAGYHYDVKWSKADAVEIQFYSPDKSFCGASSFSMADAERAGLLSNPTWKKFPRNMLFARAMMNGARWYAPDIALGMYDPEELGGEPMIVEERKPKPPTPTPMSKREDAREAHTVVLEAVRPLDTQEAVAQARGQHTIQMSDGWKKANRALHACLKDHGLEREAFKKLVGVGSMKDLSEAQLLDLIKDLNMVSNWKQEMADATDVDQLSVVWSAALAARPNLFDLLTAYKDECKTRLG